MTPIPLTDTYRPAQFPCWLYAVGTPGYWMEWHIDTIDDFAEVRDKFTHWHPDQPDAPTEMPDRPWSTSPEVDAIAAHVEGTRQSDTPRTDKKIRNSPFEGPISIAFARMLERELAEAHAERAEQARLNGMGAEREAKLHGRIAELERELAKAMNKTALKVKQYEKLRYHVLSESVPDREYLVDLAENNGNGACSCEDFSCRKMTIFEKTGKIVQYGEPEATRCKHINACLVELSSLFLDRMNGRV